jgi:hypothetical protein
LIQLRLLGSFDAQLARASITCRTVPSISCRSMSMSGNRSRSFLNLPQRVLQRASPNRMFCSVAWLCSGSGGLDGGFRGSGRWTIRSGRRRAASARCCARCGLLAHQLVQLDDEAAHASTRPTAM